MAFGSTFAEATVDWGSVMVPVSGYGLSVAITSGRMTSCSIERVGGRPLKLLNVVDEFTRECLAIEVARKQSSRDGLRTLAGLMLKHCIPKHIRSDKGPEFVAKAVRDWLPRLEVGTLFIEPGSPWENGYPRASTGNSGTNS